MRPHYRIGKPALPVVAGGAFILAGILLIAGLGGGSPPAPSPVPAPLAIASSAVPTVTASSTASSTASATPTRDPNTPIPPGYRIQITRLGIDLPIAEGDVARDIDQQKTPVGFAFHLPGTAIPGLGGNTYLYAHARTGMFLTLWNAKIGDEVLINTPDHGVLKYVIAEVHERVPPTDVSLVQPTLTERLSLQTSTGPNPSDPRFVAVAVPAPSP